MRPADALRIASTIFSEGLAHLHAGRLSEALANFEHSLSINQQYLQPASFGSVSCYYEMAAVHDKLGNLREAAHYYERAKHQLSSGPPPQSERGLFSRRKRAELMRQVQQRLDLMPRTPVPKVGVGVPLADVRALYHSLTVSGDSALAGGDTDSARLAFEQALSLCRANALAATSDEPSAASSASSATAAASQSSLGGGGAAAVADCLSRLAEVHTRAGHVIEAEAHLLAAIDVLTGARGVTMNARRVEAPGSLSLSFPLSVCIRVHAACVRPPAPPSHAYPPACRLGLPLASLRVRSISACTLPTCSTAHSSLRAPLLRAPRAARCAGWWTGRRRGWDRRNRARTSRASETSPIGGDGLASGGSGRVLLGDSPLVAGFRAAAAIIHAAHAAHAPHAAHAAHAIGRTGLVLHARLSRDGRSSGRAHRHHVWGGSSGGGAPHRHWFLRDRPTVGARRDEPCDEAPCAAELDAARRAT